MVPKYHDFVGVPIKYYSNSAGCRRERKCNMRSKQLAVWCGLASVLLMSLSAAAAPGLARTSPGTIVREVVNSSNSSSIFTYGVATPRFSWTPTWRGALIVRIECATPGAEIWYSWNGAVRRYEYPLYISSDAIVVARAFKTGCSPSDISILIIDFPPFGS